MATKIYPRSTARQIIDWTRVQNHLDDVFMFPMTDAVFNIFVSLVGERGLWPATYRITDNGNGTYESPETDTEEWDKLENAISVAISDGTEFMTRFTDLIEQQAAIEDAIRDLRLTMAVSCGSGASGGSGGGSGSYGENVPEYNVPDNRTEAEYTEYKCTFAHWLYDRLIALLDIADGFVATVLASALTAIGATEIVLFLTTWGSADDDDEGIMDYLLILSRLTSPGMVVASFRQCLIDNKDELMSLWTEAEDSNWIVQTIEAVFGQYSATFDDALLFAFTKFAAAMAKFGLNFEASLPDYSALCGYPSVLGDWYVVRDCGGSDIPFAMYSPQAVCGDSLRYSDYCQGQADNNHTYMYARNLQPDNAVRRFEIVDIFDVGAQTDMTTMFYPNNDFTGEAVHSVSQGTLAMSPIDLAGVNSVYFRTSQNPPHAFGRLIITEV